MSSAHEKLALALGGLKARPGAASTAETAEDKERRLSVARAKNAGSSVTGAASSLSVPSDAKGNTVRDAINQAYEERR